MLSTQTFKLNLFTDSLAGLSASKFQLSIWISGTSSARQATAQGCIFWGGKPPAQVFGVGGTGYGPHGIQPLLGTTANPPASPGNLPSACHVTTVFFSSHFQGELRCYTHEGSMSVFHACCRDETAKGSGLWLNQSTQTNYCCCLSYLVTDCRSTLFAHRINSFCYCILEKDCWKRQVAILS